MTSTCSVRSAYAVTDRNLTGSDYLLIAAGVVMNRVDRHENVGLFVSSRTGTSNEMLRVVTERRVSKVDSACSLLFLTILTN